MGDQHCREWCLNWALPTPSGFMRTVNVLASFNASLQSFTGDFRPRPDLAQLMLTTLPAFGECERDLIRERQREGIAIAKAKGSTGPEESVGTRRD